MTPRLSLPSGALLLAACSTCPTDFPPEIPLPDPPRLPAVTAGEVACLHDPVWRKLVARDALLRAHVRELRGILEELHARPPPP